MSAIPKDVRQEGPETLVIAWADGTESRFRVYDLRVACPCASCVDEITGEKRLDPAGVPADVRPVTITSVGNYALKIVWSDGHDTGIYSYEYLKTLGERM